MLGSIGRTIRAAKASRSGGRMISGEARRAALRAAQPPRVPRPARGGGGLFPGGVPVRGQQSMFPDVVGHGNPTPSVRAPMPPSPRPPVRPQMPGQGKLDLYPLHVPPPAPLRVPQSRHIPPGPVRMGGVRGSRGGNAMPNARKPNNNYRMPAGPGPRMGGVRGSRGRHSMPNARRMNSNYTLPPPPRNSAGAAKNGSHTARWVVGGAAAVGAIGWAGSGTGSPTDKSSGRSTGMYGY